MKRIESVLILCHEDLRLFHLGIQGLKVIVKSCLVNFLDFGLVEGRKGGREGERGRERRKGRGEMERGEKERKKDEKKAVKEGRKKVRKMGRRKEDREKVRKMRRRKDNWKKGRKEGRKRGKKERSCSLFFLMHFSISVC